MVNYIPDVMEVEIRAMDTGQHVENTLWCKGSHPHPTGTELDTVAQIVHDWVLANTNLWHNRVHFIEVVATDRSQETGAQSTRPFTNVSGSDGSGILPTSTSSTVTTKTGIAGRSRRGRMYMFGLGTDMLADAINLTSTQVDHLNTAWTALMNSLNTAGLNWVVASRVRIDYEPLQSVRANFPIRGRDSRQAGEGI